MGRRRRRRRVSRRKARPAPKKRKKLTNKKTPRRSVKKRVVNKKTPKYRSRKEGLKANQKRIANKKKTESKKTRPSRRRNVGKAAPPPKKRTPPTNNKTPKYRSRKEGLDANRKRIEAKKTVAPKSRDQKMRDAARKRHENFKKTVAETGRRVQTFGGTRKNYSYADARALEKAHGGAAGFARVTGGAKNPLARPPINPNTVPGEVMPQVQSFNESLGLTDLSKTPMVNYNFSQRDTSLPSMGQLAKTDLSGFARSVGADKFRNMGGGSRNAFSARPDTNLNMRDLFQAKDLGNMTTNAINTIVDKIPIIGEKLPNLMPMSMTDRDRQQYLGYNPNKPSSYLKQQGRYNDGSGRSDMGGPNNQFIKPEPVENTIVEENNPLANLTEIQQDAYNTALENYNAGTGYSGQGEGTGFGNLSQEVIAALMAGNRGRKRFRYGTAKKRGSDSLLTRGSERFKGFTTTGQLNI